mgnify:CR=1 FL=1
MKTSRRGFFKFPAAASAAEVVPGLPKPKAKGFGLAPLEHGGLLGTGAEVSDKSLGGPVRQRYEEEVEQGIRTADPGKIGHG